MPPDHGERLTTPALLLALGIAVLLHVGGALTVFGLIHDEALSYLASTGHVGQYEMACRRSAYPVGYWAPVSEWRRFLEIEDPFVFDRISRDLAAFDRHPPLYFWLLHVWALAIGGSTAAARMFGVVLNLGIAALLSGIAWRLLRQRTSALAAACFWLLSPTALKSALTIRHYTLFALIALMFAYVLWRYLRSEHRGLHREWRSIALTLIVLAGLLTHYHFMFVIAAGGLAIVAVHLQPRRLGRLPRELALLSAHVATSAALLLLLNGHYLQPIFATVAGDSVGKRVAFPRLVAWPTGRPSLANVLERPIAYFVPESLWPRLFTSPSLRLIAAALLILLAALAAYVVARASRRAPSLTSHHGEFGSMAVFMGIVMLAFWGISVALYLNGYSPPHVMSDYRYFAPVGVFIPLVLLGLMQALHLCPYRWPITVVLLVCMLASSTFSILREARRQPSVLALRAIAAELRLAQPPFYGHHYILVDNLQQGAIFTLVRWLPDDSLIYCADPDALLSRPDAWLSRIKEQGGFYVPLGRQPGVPEQQILKALQAAVSVEPLQRGNYGRVYRLTPLGSRESS